MRFLVKTCLAALLIASSSAHAAIKYYTFEGTIDNYSQYDQQSAEYYSSVYGVNIGDEVSFTIAFDFSAPGMRINPDGSREYLHDDFYSWECSERTQQTDCFHNEYHSYAELINSSIDSEALIKRGDQGSYSASYYEDQEWHYSGFGYVSLGDSNDDSGVGYLTFSPPGGRAEYMYVSNYDIAFKMELDDGLETQHFIGEFTLSEISDTPPPPPVPVPAAVWLFAPALVCLFRFKRIKS